MIYIKIFNQIIKQIIFHLTFQVKLKNLHVLLKKIFNIIVLKKKLQTSKLEASSLAFQQYIILSSFFGEHFPKKLKILEKLLIDAGINYNIKNYSQMLLLLKIQQKNVAEKKNIQKIEVQNENKTEEKISKTPFRRSASHVAIAYAIHLKSVILIKYNN